MINVDDKKCILCKLCIKDCPVKCITLTNEKINVNKNKCMKCGHCIAICPKNAVSTDEYNMDEVIDYNKEEFEINPNNLLNFIKFRRSIRHFKKDEVEEEKIRKIIEAGRFTQTSTNNQDVYYIVVRNDISTLKEMVLEGLNEKGSGILNNLSDETKHLERYAKMWISMYKQSKEDPNYEDRIYFNAPLLILVISKTPINGGLASTNMELMTNALGLGTFYSGFTVRASQGNKKIRDFLGLQKNEEIITCMAIGYSDINYKRTVPRKDATIYWR